MKQVDRLIPVAIPLIAKRLTTSDPSNRNVPAVYKGYISSMGASIILSGLIPTLAFYHADTQDSASEQARRPLLDILHEMLRHRYTLSNQDSLLDYALNLQEKNKLTALRELRRDVVNASIAVKLALRTFHLDDSKTN